MPFHTGQFGVPTKELLSRTATAAGLGFSSIDRRFELARRGIPVEAFGGQFSTEDKARATALKFSAGDAIKLGGDVVDLIKRVLRNGGGGGGEISPLVAARKCKNSQILVAGVCVDPGAALPFGDPLFSRPSGVAVEGAFGMPAFSPAVELVETRRCPPRMVLGFDNLCYPKAVLPPRSQFRKWKRAPSPTLSRRDEAAINRAAGAKDRVLTLAKKAGLFASKTRPATKGKGRGHQHLLAAPTQTLRVISEETN